MVLAAAERASRRRSAWMSAVSGTVIAAVVSTVAILHAGFEVQRADLNDGSLWVVNGERQSAARANLQIGALDAVVVGEGSDLAVRHHRNDVVVIDRINAQAEVLEVKAHGRFQLSMRLYRVVRLMPRRRAASLMLPLLRSMAASM